MSCLVAFFWLGPSQEGYRKNYPSSSKNNLQHFQLSDTTGTSNGTGFYGQMKQKKIEFWLQILQMSLVQTGIKKYPMYTVKYSTVFLNRNSSLTLENTS